MPLKPQKAKPSVAVIGAGISGLSVAQALQNVAMVSVFEKSRGVGGRMATRRAEPYAFDHGAQFFTARSRAFKRFIMPFVQSGFVDEWKPKLITLKNGKKPYKRSWFEPHWVAVPGMSDLCKQMAKSLNIRLKTRIMQMQRDERGWYLQTSVDQSEGPFDWVVITAPVPQTLALLPENYVDYEKLQAVEMGGCFTLMLGLNQLPKLNFQVAVVKGSPIDWVSLNSHKPWRPKGVSLVAHTHSDWTKKHLVDPTNDVQKQLVAELVSLLSLDRATIEHIDLHRWAFSRVIQPVDHKKRPYSVDSELQLAVCGDGFGVGRVETAFTSGQCLATALQRSLKRNFMAAILRR